MLSVLRTAPPQHSLADSPKAKFKTVLGLGTFQRDPETAAIQQTPDLPSARPQPSNSRKSVDAVTSYSFKRRNRQERSSVTDLSFLDPSTSKAPSTTDTSSTPPRLMSVRRAPLQMDSQDGHWTVSVAENPHDPGSFSLYIKTPTHNLTLTRTALEIVELHGKLRDTLPGLKIPALPIDTTSLPSPPKRKSAFLNTLSRLASPSGNKSANGRSASGRQSTTSNPTSQGPSSFTSPAQSPAREIADPFSSIGDLHSAGIRTTVASSNSNVTGLAAYLTTLSNNPSVRPSRLWKRFVRVRTDDLQSVRVERAIKRVRSDLAAHASPSSSDIPRSISQVVSSDGDVKSVKTPVPETPIVPGGVDTDSLGTENGGGGSLSEEKPDDDEAMPENDDSEATAENGTEGEQDRAPTPRSPNAASTILHDESASVTSEDSTIITNGADLEDDAPTTPMAADSSTSHAARIPRSQSADPTSRASRIYPISPLREDTSSQTSQTGDDSSISTTGRSGARKKRSKSMDPKKSQRKVVVDDFEMMRVLGKGCAGKVLLVRHKTTLDVYALKAITKRHVLAHQELQHTLTEQAVLKRMAAEGSDPFVVKLWWSFHDKENLFLVMDFHPGGDLATQLARWGRLGRDRARFYAAEIVEGVEGLHAAGVIYRDLKPENILIGADGHIVLTDFGLSKEFPRKTSANTVSSAPSGFRGDFTAGTPTPAVPHWMRGDKVDLTNGWTPSPDTTRTFCGTAEYLAPEVIQGNPYSYEVDWWSFGTMLYEMLTGITPFWADNHTEMYFKVLQNELQFPEDKAMDQDTKSLIRGLLQRNPGLRMKEPRIKKHPYFSMIDWSHVYYKRYIPPYIPPIDPSNASDTQNFDDTFLDMEPVIKDEEDEEEDTTDTEAHTDTDRTDGEDSVPTPSQSRSPSVHPEENGVDVFDGYSFKGRHSVILDDEDDGDEEDGSYGDDESIHPSLVSEEPIPEESILEESIPEADEDATTDVPPLDDVPEPKTPEARPAVISEPVEPILTTSSTPIHEDAQSIVAKEPEATPRSSHDEVARVNTPPPSTSASTAMPEAPVIVEKKPEVKPVVSKAPASRSTRRARREKSGIAALDRRLSDAVDVDLAADRYDDDDDWDFVENTGVSEERNGAKGTSLFARGVVDRYRLAVFRKSTPRRPTGPRMSSGLSVDSDTPGEQIESPTPSEKRRGRTPGITFRKTPKQFLGPKSPPSSRSSATTTKTLAHSASATLSGSTSSAGLLTPSASGTSSLAMSHSLKSKESAISMGSPSESSDTSINGDLKILNDNTAKGASVISMEDEKQKSKVKKYKEGVLSIFQSPR